MGKALYRKYRSKSLAEVVGQEHITHTLEQALKSGRISHAYLFTGPRGVGKTSIARILAHEINKLPYEDDSTHLDIIEIDAASNRRIDEIRDLRDKVNIAPTSAPYKVYIIDEVHMLTKEAFNALLKTLEEPPQHVVFILATTEVHKLPETIVSRTQRFTFKPVPLDKVVAHLRSIAEQEDVKITDDALKLIAEHGEGSFRDSISLLDQASGHDGEVDLAYIQSVIGMPPLESMDALVNSLASHDAAQIVQLLGSLRDQGFQPAQIAKQLGIAWRQRILDNGSGSPEDFALLQKLLAVPAAHNPERYLEILLLEFVLSSPSAPVMTPAQKPVPAKPAAKQEKVTPTPIPTETKDDEKEVNPQEDVTEPASEPTTEEDQPTTMSAVVDEAIWPQVLAELKKKYNTLYGVVRMARPAFHDNTLELGFSFAFHRKRLSEAKNQQIVANIIKDITGQSVIIECVDSKESPAPITAAAEVAQASAEIVEPVSAPKKTKDSPDISTISNIFGGGELLES
jgi:DNA polymerase III subunit gamma/tau